MTDDALFEAAAPFWLHEESEDGRIYGRTFVVSETEHWVMAVVPMGFNDRITIVRKEFWGRGWDAGFCYDKNGSAFVEAALFNPERWQRPRNFKKIAHDMRPCEPDEKQLVCQFCAGDRRLVDAARASEFNIDPRNPQGFDLVYGDYDLACVCCGSVEPPHPVSARKYAWFWTDVDTVRAFRTPRGKVIY